MQNQWSLTPLLDNERVHDDPRCKASTGECVEALIVAILQGKHTLYRVDELLEPYDLEVAFGWESDWARFSEQRLAKALDDVFASGPQQLYSAVLTSAVRNYDLGLTSLHFDTTSIKLQGDYALSSEPDDPEDPSAVPNVTYGYSKDHRPDLKQIVLGLTVSGDGAVLYRTRLPEHRLVVKRLGTFPSRAAAPEGLLVFRWRGRGQPEWRSWGQPTPSSASTFASGFRLPRAACPQDPHRLTTPSPPWLLSRCVPILLRLSRRVASTRLARAQEAGLLDEPLPVVALDEGPHRCA